MSTYYLGVHLPPRFTPATEVSVYYLGMPLGSRLSSRCTPDIQVYVCHLGSEFHSFILQTVIEIALEFDSPHQEVVGVVKFDVAASKALERKCTNRRSGPNARLATAGVASDTLLYSNFALSGGLGQR